MGLEFDFAFGRRERERKIFQFFCECVGDYDVFYTLELPQGNKQSKSSTHEENLSCVVKISHKLIY